MDYPPPPPPPPAPSRFDPETGQCPRCDQLPGNCHCFDFLPPGYDPHDLDLLRPEDGNEVTWGNLFDRCTCTAVGRLGPCAICHPTPAAPPPPPPQPWDYRAAPPAPLPPPVLVVPPPLPPAPREELADYITLALAGGFPPVPPPPGYVTWRQYAEAHKHLPRMVTTPPPPQGIPRPIVLTPPPGLPPAPVALPVVPPSQPGPRINVRAKGQRGEREVVKLLQVVVDQVRAKHGLAPMVIQRNLLQSHLGGEDLWGLTGFAIEVKFQEAENVVAWWRQTCAQAKARNALPILFYRCSRAAWTVKFRAFVSTPHDTDQHEMDLETSVQDWTFWFADAYQERIVNGLPL